MNFDEEEDEEDEDSSSSSQLNSNTRPGSATSKKSNKVRGECWKRGVQAAVSCTISGCTQAWLSCSVFNMH